MKYTLASNHLKYFVISILVLGSFNCCYGQEKIQKNAVAPFVNGTPSDVGWEQSMFQPMLDSLQLWCADEEIMGVEVLIIKDDIIVLHEAKGWADKEENQRLKKNSIFRIKSMTKPLVSTSILMLVEEGKIGSLDDPVSKYLPEMNTKKAKEITIHQLLTHTGGLSELFDIHSIRWDYYDNLQSAVKQIGSKGRQYQSGSYRYSDEGAGVAAFLVEKLTGKDLETFFKERIFNPLQMHTSFFNPQRNREFIERVNKSYRYDIKANRFVKGYSSKHSTSYGMKYLVGAFGILSTTLDYAKFIKSIMDAGYLNKKGILSSSSAFVATQAHTKNDWGGYGYFFQTNNTKNGKTINFGHSGISGTASIAFPKINTIVMYFTQSMGHANYKNFVRTLLEIDDFNRNMEKPKWLVDKRE